jgi:hypothetical protein
MYVLISAIKSIGNIKKIVENMSFRVIFAKAHESLLRYVACKIAVGAPNLCILRSKLSQNKISAV